MSHSTETVTSITDSKLLKAAVAQMKKDGVPVELLEMVEPQMWSAGQFFAKTGRQVAELVLRVPDYIAGTIRKTFDVGFYKKDNETEYTAVMDTHAGHVRRYLGHPDMMMDPEDTAQSVAIAAVTQEYQLQNAIAMVRAKGKTYTRVKVKGSTTNEVQIRVRL